MHRATRRAPLGLALALALALAPAAAQAWRLDYTLGLGAEYSDNVARLPGEGISDTILRPEVDFSLTEQGETLQAGVVGTARFEHYLDGTFDDELRADIGGRLNWVVLPERLAFTVEDYLAEEPIDVRVVNRPGNRQRTNLFSAGPTLKLRLSPAMSARLDLRYADTYAEETESFNGDRIVFGAALERELGPASRFAANLEAQDVGFDEPGELAAEYRRWAMFGRYRVETSRYSLEADLGWSRVDFDRGDDDNGGGALLRASASWAYDPNWTLALGAARQLSDAAGDLVLGAPTTASLATPVTVGRSFTVAVSPDVFTERRLTADLTRRADRWSFGLAGFWRRQTFERAGSLDQDGRGLVATADYSLSPLTSVGVFAGRSWQSFDGADQDDRELDLGLRLNMRLSRNLGLLAEVTRADRESDLDANDFDELRAYVGVAWSRR